MEDILLAISVLAGGLGVFVIIAHGEAMKLEKSGKSVGTFFISIAVFFLSAVAAFYSSRVEERTLNAAHTFIIKAKGQSSFGVPLWVYDEDSKRERTIVVNEYPPDGLIEVTATDGEVMLIPVKKK